MTLIMSDHDKREDLAGELWLVAGLLKDEGRTFSALKCREMAIATKTGDITLAKATRGLCHFENLIGA
ncbi:hypothetical protein SEA_FAYELY_95 [Mycobacterium phage Fayely]|uniref:DUF7273 domain-containing protein n=4 Tax=Fromanvirus alma TaxID=1089111 RepID=A0A142K503_9CAUD|nr:hypothetical protein CM07_gp11 [Mycobacterium phage Alma]AMS00895.1 hypothetical protein PBI_EIDSMOE_95 [Mycobacterium phage Eidsmoe]AVI03804.1 hypothetical protein SEA_CONQUERAGE_95 [Mycobacterium phage Conquerage]AXC35106.1 hypothetical protein SEA_PRIYA_95 [Mycobacterium phage Priya]AZF93571.1 hypothetical protein SEA_EXPLOSIONERVOSA_95 [Mycobacterium phage ExplosioNervosa]UVF60957.1 hypothetical protein SEA_FAYELY_95 [Mycobacterium phage Fayely]